MFPFINRLFPMRTDPSSSASSTKAEMKKSFTADSGLKYQWDEEENDWVEFEGPERSDVMCCMHVTTAS